MKRAFWVASAILVIALGAAATETEVPTLDEAWPKQIEVDGRTFVIYQPQLDSWDRFTYVAHSAVAVSEGEDSAQVFGVVWFRARTQVDKEGRLVVFDQIDVVNAEFPSAPDQKSTYLKLLNDQFADVVRAISLDRVEANLAIIEAETQGKQVPVKNDPPTILFSETAAMLVNIDGEPVFHSVEDSKYERLINTRTLILKHVKKGTLYLHVFDGWMKADRLDGPWVVAKSKSALTKAKEKALTMQGADLLEGGGGEGEEKPSLKKGPVPAVRVATGPTELIVFDGEPNYVPVSGTDLLFADNTSGHVFKHIGDQQSYVLISGRWFAARTLNGPWTYVAQADLPGDFSRIPDDNPKENVKASVAGTDQAKEALIANSIPQTAEVKRSEAKFTSTIDGKAKLEPIAGTDLEYVVNSPDPIVKVEASFFAVHNGVWFVSGSSAGPWQVASSVPPAIYAIPASSPMHYVTYVKIYDSDPDVVVVGYSPGYYGTVVVDNVVVYGSGYYWSPWIGHHYYGHPYTYGWGCGITYSPWGGWSFTFGVGLAWGHWGSPWYAPYPYPYWGPYHGYGYPYHGGGMAFGAHGGAVAWGPGGWAGTTGNVYRQWGSVASVSRYSGGYNAWTGTGWREQVGTAYNSRTGTLAAGQRAAVGNIYTGEYAYGGRGVAVNERTGAVAAGSRVTVGDVDTGRQVTAGRGAVYNPRTGEGTRVGAVHGEQGTAIRVGNDVYAGHDGSVYRHSDRGQWEQAGKGGSWQGVKDSARTRDLNRQRSARQSGQQRTSNYNRGSRSASRGSMGGSRGGSRGGRRR